MTITIIYQRPCRPAAAHGHSITYQNIRAAVRPDRADHRQDTHAAAQALNADGADSVFILYDVYTIGLANQVKDQVKALLREEGGGHEN